MKKILYVLAFIGLIWLAKLSYDNYLFSGQLNSIQDELHKSEQTVANLNDQLVATQRNAINPTPQNPLQQNQANKNQATNNQPQPNQASPNAVAVKQMVGLSPTLLLKQKIALIQFALEQQQFVYAVEQLNQLDLDIERYDLADTLRETLHQAVVQDRQMIQQYVATRAVQLTQLNEILQQVERSLTQQQRNNRLTVGTTEQTHFWQKWFKIDLVEKNESDLIHRKLILKEVQLRVLLAQQALLRGDFVAYQSMLDLIDVELQSLPDQYSRTLQGRISKLKQKKHLTPVSKLSSSAILEQ